MDCVEGGEIQVGNVTKFLGEIYAQSFFSSIERIVVPISQSSSPIKVAHFVGDG